MKIIAPWPKSTQTFNISLTKNKTMKNNYRNYSDIRSTDYI